MLGAIQQNLVPVDPTQLFAFRIAGPWPARPCGNSPVAASAWAGLDGLSAREARRNHLTGNATDQHVQQAVQDGAIVAWRTPQETVWLDERSMIERWNGWVMDSSRVCSRPHYARRLWRVRSRIDLKFVVFFVHHLLQHDLTDAA
jgi:hypothetical protein